MNLEKEKIIKIQIQISSFLKKMRTLRRAFLILILNEILIRITIVITMYIVIVKKKFIKSLIILIVINLKLMSLR